MVARSGASLVEDAAVEAILGRMLPRATLLTPNTPEAAGLTGLVVEDLKGQIAAGERLIALGAKAVLIKAGHLGGDPLEDLLCTPRGMSSCRHRGSIRR